MCQDVSGLGFSQLIPTMENQGENTMNMKWKLGLYIGDYNH